jgi:1,4-alpha-glucan branching enzyme
VSRDVDPAEIEAFLDGCHADPHRLLAPRIVRRDGRSWARLRAWHPSAVAAEVALDGRPDVAMQRLAPGLFEAFLSADVAVPRHTQRFRFASGERWEREDPYRFAPTLGELDLHLFGEGRHWRLWEMLGAHPMCCDGVDGVRFAVWAPNARGASVVGGFSAWDRRMLPMRALGSSGVFELFVPGVEVGALYKFVLTTASGDRREKTDPFARAMECPPATAARVAATEHAWRDADWLRRRAEHDLRRAPFTTCEVHLGSFARVPEEDGRVLGYRELAPRLAEHALGLGYTHLQLLPVMEHPYTPSWGYQVSGYFAPTARYGSPDDLRHLIDHCHERGIGVLLDWVPAHFPRDDWALRRFDGTPLYEHADPRRGEHPDWGTLIFDYGRAEVRNFLLASPL